MTDFRFRIPAIRWAEAQSQHQSQVFSYLFTYRSPAMGGILGACHALEIPFVFGTLGEKERKIYPKRSAETDAPQREDDGGLDLLRPIRKSIPQKYSSLGPLRSEKEKYHDLGPRGQTQPGSLRAGTEGLGGTFLVFQKLNLSHRPTQTNNDFCPADFRRAKGPLIDGSSINLFPSVFVCLVRGKKRIKEEIDHDRQNRIR